MDISRETPNLYITLRIQMYVYVCIYIYIEREREREGERDTHIHIHICKYSYFFPQTRICGSDQQWHSRQPCFRHALGARSSVDHRPPVPAFAGVIIGVSWWGHGARGMPDSRGENRRWNRNPRPKPHTFSRLVLYKLVNSTFVWTGYLGL